MTLISIITPAYNAAPYIGDTIRSVLAQSHSEWEMIIADDGSTDGTPSAAREVAAGDARVQVHEFAPSRLPSVARNRALAKARGEIIAFLDADDLFLPRKLEVQLAALGGRDWGFGNCTHFWADGTFADAEHFPADWKPPVPFLPTLMTSSIGIPFPTVMARRSALEAISPTGRLADVFDEDPEARAVEDWDVCLRLARRSEPVYLAATHARYREHLGGISKAGETPFLRSIRIVEKMRAAGVDAAVCDRARRVQESKLAVARLLGGKGDWRGLLWRASFPPAGARELFFAGLAAMPAPVARAVYTRALRAHWAGR